MAKIKDKSKKKTASPAKPAKSSDSKPAKSSTDSMSAKSSVDSKIKALDQKWSEQFNKLEALLLARTLDKPQEPTFKLLK